jgi:hypothetical protein
MGYIPKYTRLALTNFVIGVLVFLIGQFIYWQVFPYQTADIETPMVVLNENKEVRVGGELRLFLEINKQSEYTPTVSRNIVCDDRSVHFVQSTQTGGTARPQGVYTASPVFIVPTDLPVGATCEFEFQNDYPVNPVRTITKKWRSEPFTIIE